ncbi:glutathione-dependent formaldehyde-activating enzyme [Zopfia rhizophila CBS 207.26]|uniref:Glutathione-dependent formaldehyde-activating enzyme n=1 Tax=Zopfia rhizophila CBS 207.26 TaxID=1314779 RepID=A0A6A6EBC7_9PEZI|nr:glutathione-dependent formaldehyde-activating enzyme [Zopfia rhizophila CBS 207.26]
MSSPHSQSEPSLTGSCFCRHIKYTLTDIPFNALLCHCDNCGRTSGVGFIANSFYLKNMSHSIPASTTLTSKPSIATKFQRDNTDSGTVLKRSFCGHCGSSLFAKSDAYENVVIVTSGSLDERKEWKPRNEVYYKNKASWIVIKGDTEV